MSYETIAISQSDVALQRRVTSCIAQEGVVPPYPVFDEIMWDVVTAADVEAAYASAIANGNPDPGNDPAVISDGMILAHVQAGIANLPTAEPTSSGNSTGT